MPRTLPVPVPQGRSRGRSRGRPRRSRRQKQEHVDGGHSIGGGELIDWTVAANSMANALNQNRRENEQRIGGSDPSKKKRGK